MAVANHHPYYVLHVYKNEYHYYYYHYQSFNNFYFLLLKQGAYAVLLEDDSEIIKEFYEQVTEEEWNDLLPNPIPSLCLFVSPSLFMSIQRNISSITCSLQCFLINDSTFPSASNTLFALSCFFSLSLLSPSLSLFLSLNLSQYLVIFLS